MSEQYKFIENDSLKNVFINTASPLFKPIEAEGYKIDLYFVKDHTINAFALPGGKVIIQTGLIENAKSWEEIMGVLSHELAHVTKRHHIRGVIHNIGIFAILAATLGDVGALAVTFIDIGSNLASLQNIREFENEADEAGWEYLVKANINPRGLISFFETLKNEHKTKADTSNSHLSDISFLSTHPNTKDRISRLNLKEKKLKKTFVPMTNNFDAFKKSILSH